MLDSLQTEGNDFLPNADSPLTEEVRALVKAYDTVFGREPDLPGFNFWIEKFRDLRDGDADIRDDVSNILGVHFADSPEYKSLYPEGTTNEEFLTDLYMNQFNRTPDQAGFDYWIDFLNSNQLDRADVISCFIMSDEYEAQEGSRIDQCIVNLGKLEDTTDGVDGEEASVFEEYFCVWDPDWREEYIINFERETGKTHSEQGMAFEEFELMPWTAPDGFFEKAADAPLENTSADAGDTSAGRVDSGEPKLVCASPGVKASFGITSDQISPNDILDAIARGVEVDFKKYLSPDELTDEVIYVESIYQSSLRSPFDLFKWYGVETGDVEALREVAPTVFDIPDPIYKTQGWINKENAHTLAHKLNQYNLDDIESYKDLEARLPKVYIKLGGPMEFELIPLGGSDELFAEAADAGDTFAERVDSGEQKLVCASPGVKASFGITSDWISPNDILDAIARGVEVDFKKYLSPDELTDEVIYVESIYQSSLRSPFDLFKWYGVETGDVEALREVAPTVFDIPDPIYKTQGWIDRENAHTLARKLNQHNLDDIESYKDLEARLPKVYVVQDVEFEGFDLELIPLSGSDELFAEAADLLAEDNSIPIIGFLPSTAEQTDSVF